MKISQIRITKLFGYFNHTIPLNTKEHITILHGPNGIGKTTILRAVRDLFSKRFDSLFALSFDEIQLELIPDGIFTLKRSKADTEVSLAMSLSLGGSQWHHTVKSSLPPTLTGASELPTPEIMQQISQLLSENSIETPDPDSSFQDAHILSLLALSDFGRRRKRNPFPEALNNFFKSVNIVLIETQRLLHQSSPEQGQALRSSKGAAPGMAVEAYAKELVSTIQSTMQESGSRSASLDRTFPQRVLATALHVAASEDEIRSRYNEQMEYRERLMRAGLMNQEDSVSLPETTLNDSERKLLSVYLHDAQEKLQIFDALLSRVELLQEIINSRFLYKQFNVDKTSGFKFVSSYDSVDVPLKALSSGEQHELVLAYELLFRASRNSLVFIDEPELSLHVSWQRKLLDDIAKISAIVDLDFVIATHSPAIVSNRRDLMIEIRSDDM